MRHRNMNNVNRASSGTYKVKQYKGSIVFDPIRILLPPRNKVSADQKLHTDERNGLRTSYPETCWIQMMAGRFGRAVMSNQLPKCDEVPWNRCSGESNEYKPERGYSRDGRKKKHTPRDQVVNSRICSLSLRVFGGIVERATLKV